MTTCALGRILAGMVNDHDMGAGGMTDAIDILDEGRHVDRAVLVAASDHARQRVDDDQLEGQADGSVIGLRKGPAEPGLERGDQTNLILSRYRPRRSDWISLRHPGCVLNRSDSRVQEEPASASTAFPCCHGIPRKAASWKMRTTRAWI